MFGGFFPFVRRPVWTIDLSQTLWEVLDIKSGLEGGEDVLSSSGNSCPTMYCGTRSLINDILRSGGGEGRTRRKQNCDFTRWLSLSINSWSSFHLGCCHFFTSNATALFFSLPLYFFSNTKDLTISAYSDKTNKSIFSTAGALVVITV